MRIDKIGRDATYLIPHGDGGIRIGVLPAADGGIAAAICLETENLGNFTIPLNKWQIGTITAVCNWLLKLDADQLTDLRARLERELKEEQPEGNQE